jgi:GNAT superfamily N-acetyltransferase
MDIRIRKAEVKDFKNVLSLIKELAEYERASEKVTNTVDLMITEKDYFDCFVAETSEGEIIGMAVYYFVYYTWVGKSLYLDDIYVKEEHRKRGIGRELLKKVFEVAASEGCKRVRWQVLGWNTSAINVYRKAGADIDDEWLNCTFDENGIREFSL